MLFGPCSTIAIGKRLCFAMLLVATLMVPQPLLAAIGCTLSNPAEDLLYLYPKMTSYKEDLNEFSRLKTGRILFKELQERLGSDLDPIYETYDTPYTIYFVFSGKTKIGVVHGVNVPGKGGVIQVFLATDPSTGIIQKFFFQRLESTAATLLRNKSFCAQFEGLNLGDFYKHDYYAAVQPNNPADRIKKIQSPTLGANGRIDYNATIRGIRKNLILLDFFVYGKKYEPFFERTKQALSKKRSEK